MFKKRGPAIFDEEEEEEKREALKNTHTNNGRSDNSSDSIGCNEMQRTQGQEKSEKGSSRKHKRIKLAPLPSERRSEDVLEEGEEPEEQKKQEKEEDIHHRMPKGFQMMTSMGYKLGDTLGSKENDQGLREPIQPVANDGKKGLRFGMINTSDQDDSLSTVLDEKSYRKWVSDTKTAQKKNILWQHLQKLAFEMSNDVEIYTAGQDPRDFNVLWRSYVQQLNDTCKKVPSITEPDSSDDNDDVANATTSDDDIIIASDSDDPIIGEREDVPSPEVESMPDDYDGEDEQLGLFMQMDIDERIMRLNVFLRSELYYCFYCGIKYKDEEDMFKHCPGITEADHE